ncbi:5-methylcytosine rRNA methyltransferase NSUN4 isoform X2 [Apis laboriosa]|uniref:5-methylcytosine rRNA methyltransferase NSUN4 isoform X2 n=1 Tax=Apis laboriosa TaxID=183418 RepID=UPI001CC751BF|nr:5-methylcytosine rRNA methyltransferase NSUN4 isoform X2 [Apis laboriosa]
MALLLDKLRLKKIVKLSVRYIAGSTHGKDHWSVVKKKKTTKDKALEYFDDFYANIYKNSWKNIRTALLKKDSKYMAVVNNFSDTEKIRSNLESKREAKYGKSDDIQNSIEAETSIDQMAELQAAYPANYPNLESEALKAETTESDKKSENKIFIKLQSIDASLNDINIDNTRIVDSSVNLSMLQEYVPTNKIKGLDDWVLESDHYKFYTKADDFKVNVENEHVLPFPEHLHVYTFERDNYTRFPSPKKGSTGVLDYYLFDGGSILPVLALDIQLGDIVLDMCAAPGGKALTILQTLMPRLLIANDIVKSRIKRIENVMNQFVSNICEKENMFLITQQDARAINENGRYNKILVDVPCTTDRHNLHSDENNIFKSSRLKERLKLPEIQSEILANALKLVSIGGTVVYSTCSLNPIQNDGVVQVALKKAWQESNCVMVVKDMTEALLPLRCIYDFGKIGLKYGHIVIPTSHNNWGPMYFCKIVKVQ